MKIPAPNYNKRVVAFIDILGFENIVRSLPNNAELFNKLNWALHRIKSIEGSKSRPNSVAADLEVSVFSDSIVISSEEERISSLMWTVGWLQAELMYVGIFVRGGIAVGSVVHEDGILFGEGMLSAYRLESKAAVYPRIVISCEVFDKHKQVLANWVEIDSDAIVYINMFKFDAVAGNADELAADGYDPRAIYFKELRRHLMNGIETSSEEDHLAKYLWLTCRFNVAISEFNEQSIQQIEPISGVFHTCA